MTEEPVVKKKRRKKKRGRCFKRRPKFKRSSAANKPGPKKKSTALRNFPHHPSVTGDTSPLATALWAEQYPEEAAFYYRLEGLYNRKETVPPPFKVNPRLLAEATRRLHSSASNT